jgi:hypothetical protein
MTLDRPPRKPPVRHYDGRREPLPHNKWEFLAWACDRPGKVMILLITLIAAGAVLRMTWGPILAMAVMRLL